MVNRLDSGSCAISELHVTGTPPVWATAASTALLVDTTTRGATCRQTRVLARASPGWGLSARDPGIRRYWARLGQPRRDETRASSDCHQVAARGRVDQTPESPARGRRDPDSRSRPRESARGIGDSLFPDSGRIGNRGNGNWGLGPLGSTYSVGGTPRRVPMCTPRLHWQDPGESPTQANAAASDD